MKQQGFTLIELVVVIIILGILAATALPKFIDLKSDARKAAVQGAAGAVSSASALNYSKYQINTAQAERLNGATPCNQLITSAIPGIGLVSGLPDGIAIAAGGDTTCAGVAAGTAVDCTLESAELPVQNAVAKIICTG